MAAINAQEFITCTALRHKAGETHSINEVVSLEVPVPFTYECTVGGRLFTGQCTLYAFPERIKELILGYTVLDILPPINEETLSYSFQTSDTLHLTLTADALSQDPLPTPPPSEALMTLQGLVDTMDTTLKSAGKWDGTGCFHRAALYYPISRSTITVEDIGRHNCIDRLKGHCLMRKLPQTLFVSKCFLFITARITASLYAKIYKAGIRNIVSRAALTSTAYEQAQKDGCTLAAFCRPHNARVTLFCNGMQSIAL